MLEDERLKMFVVLERLLLVLNFFDIKKEATFWIASDSDQYEKTTKYLLCL